MALHKLPALLTEVREVLDQVRAGCAVEPGAIERHDSALEIAKRYGLMIYGALIVAAALLAG